MSVPALITIGERVEPVASWIPERDQPDRVFTYIDLSAIDQNAKIITGARRLPCATAPSRARQIVQAGDILVSTVRPNLNGVALVPPEFDGATASTGFCVLRPVKDSLDPRYLFQWVKSPLFVGEMVRRATGASYPAVSDRIVCQSKLPLPPMLEQQRIADILDSADALYAKRSVALKRLDELTQSIFCEMFGDPATNPKGWPLADFASVIFFQEGPGVRNWQFRSEGIKLINVRNIVNGELDTSNSNRYLSPIEVAQKYQHFLLDEGDLVVASSGVTWGKVAEVSAAHLPLCLNTSMIRLRPRGRNIEKGFIRTFIESFAFRKQIHRLITGSAQPNFGPAHLEQVKIPLPTVDLQREYVERVARIEKLRGVQGRSLVNLDTLIRSLRHDAFRGEL